MKSNQKSSSPSALSVERSALNAPSSSFPSALSVERSALNVPSPRGQSRTGIASRRRDAHVLIALPGSHWSLARARGHAPLFRALRSAAAPSVDSAGRFIGRFDVERGFTFFKKSRGQAVEQFSGGGSFGGEFGRGTQGKRQPRTNLSVMDLLAIHERAARGEKPYLIAKAYGVDRTTIVYALLPSPAMQRALATQNAAAA